jgi:GntR family transcriptional regulator, transcriptional repressor for pyruvate dehydrogenase complex
MLDRKRIADQIFNELRNDIVSGKLPRGAKLPAERELTLRFQVSNPTVREAVRGLSLLGLVDVRHGSGAYVKGDATSLIAMTLGGAIQLGNLGMDEVLSVAGALIELAATSAARVATPEELAALRAALVALDRAQSPEIATEAVAAFYNALLVAAHNPLLAALCLFLVKLQIELAKELAGHSPVAWRKLQVRLRPLRASLVEAIVSRDHAGVGAAARDFHRKGVAVITSLPKAKEVRLRDPQLRQTLSSTLTRLGAA